MTRANLNTLLLAVIILGAFAMPAAQGVAPGALLYIAVVEDRNLNAFVRVAPTAEAPQGDVTVMVRLVVEPYNGTGPQSVLEHVVTVAVPAPSQERRHNTTNVHFELPNVTGMYRLRGSIHGDAAGTGRAWDEYSKLLAFGTPPADLAYGWGRIQANQASTLDLVQSGSPTITVRDAEAAPSTWDLEATATPWESKTARGWTFTLRAWNPAAENESAHFDLNASTIRNIIQAQPGQELRTQQGEEGTITLGSETIRVDFEPRPFPPDTWWTRSVYASVSTVFAKPVTDIVTRGWYNGYETRVNLTNWDLDGDGTNDMLFWENTANSDAEARAQADSERRSAPAKLGVHAVVNESLQGRTVDFELFRVDRTHHGAWMELRAPDAVIREALSSPYMDSNASLQYELSLAPPEGFVEERENVTWAWFGHFSTQRMRILVPFDAAKVPWRDADGDGAPNAQDTCDGDDRIDTDHDDTPDACDDAVPTSASLLPGASSESRPLDAPSVAMPTLLATAAAVLGAALLSARRRH